MLPACDSDDSEVSVDAFDGRYNLTYVSDGQIAAIADTEVNGGVVGGRVVNDAGIVFRIEGTVDSSGTISYDSITASDGTSASASGAFDTQGTVEGSYSVLDRSGIYFGFRYGDMDALNNAYDGDYTMRFTLDGEDVDVQTVTVQDGWFQFTLNLAGGVAVEGSVVEDGRIIARATEPELGSGILSAGQVSGSDVSGFFYTFGGRRGTLSGERL